VAPRLLGFSALWWVLSGGDARSWVLGLPAVLAAVWAAGRLSPGSRPVLRWWALARFVPFFLRESLRGGWDVARRTLAPRLAVRPGFAHYRMGLRSDPARTLFANCVSLLPGTLAADIQGDWLEVHRLTDAIDIETELARLERRIAAIFVAEGEPRR